MGNTVLDINNATAVGAKTQACATVKEIRGGVVIAAVIVDPPCHAATVEIRGRGGVDNKIQIVAHRVGAAAMRWAEVGAACNWNKLTARRKCVW